MTSIDHNGSGHIGEIQPENIPQELKSLKQWVNWAALWSADKKSFSKPPMRANGRNASSTEPGDWTTLEKSLAALGRDGVYRDRWGRKHQVTLDGIGLAGLERTDWVGVDLDGCVNPETGEINAAARKIVKTFDSYTEISPSGKGLRIWVEAEKHRVWCANKGGETDIEVYDKGRFLTATGWHLEGTPWTVEKRQEALDAFMERHAPPPECPETERRPYTGPQDYAYDLEGLLDKAGVVFKQASDATSERTYHIVCPWAHEHSGGDTSGTRVGQYASGAPWFHCEHAHCAGRRWEQFREELEPEAYRKVEIMVGGKRLSNDSNDSNISTTTPTHDELRDRFIKASGSSRPYAHGLGDWRRYQSGIWQPVAETSVKAGISSVVEAAKPEGVKPTTAIVSSVTEMARIRVFFADEEWDADPDILVCANGALQIPTRKLGPHDPAHHATSAVPYDYDPEAVPVAWHYLLKSTVPEATAFLQEFAGYALTTDTSHELAVWLQGPRGSGKSTVIAGLQAMLGHRAGVLGLADLERSRFTLANLPGKTLMVAREQPTSYLASTDVLDTIISGEPLQVERKYHDPYTVIPRAKVCWAMNELPRVANANAGIFRRVKVVVFPELAEKERDPEVKRRVTQEGAGILNWALEGLERLRERGRFEIPASVREATAEFEGSNDVTAAFLDERCVLGEGGRISGQMLYEAYNQWCRDNGHTPQSSTRVAQEWKRHGLEKRRISGVSYYLGLRLKMNSGVA